MTSFNILYINPNQTLLIQQRPLSPESNEMFKPEPATPRQPKRRRRNSRHTRPKFGQDDYKDLLVFGYEARVFRDDALAERVDRSEFLIPWRGELDGKLMMDR